MASFISDYNSFLQYGGLNREALFYIIEYQRYNNQYERYSILQNEILAHPQDFKERLNNKVYRIWLTVPYDNPW